MTVLEKHTTRVRLPPPPPFHPCQHRVNSPTPASFPLSLPHQNDQAVLVVVYFGAETYSIHTTSGHQTVAQKLLYKSWTAPNDVIAANWLRRAAQRGNAMAQVDNVLRGGGAGGSDSCRG